MLASHMVSSTLVRPTLFLHSTRSFGAVLPCIIGGLKPLPLTPCASQDTECPNTQSPRMSFNWVGRTPICFSKV
jgi:hypothetical protein